MRYKELPKKWKVITSVLIVLNALLIILIILFTLFLSSYREQCAQLRAPLKKDDSLLIGERMKIERKGKESVAVNLYMPKNIGDDKLPVVFNIHGGGFVGGDADMLDTQSDRIANEWNAVVVTINYTTADVKSVLYGSEEVRDTVLYFADHADSYHADTTRFTIMGYSAGAYYSAEAMRLLKENDFDTASLVLCYPWTTGLPTKNLSSDCPKTLFVLAGEDPISQKSKSYIEAMKAAGVDVEVIEYDSAVHSFIESNNPEGKNDPAEGMEKVINPMQEKMAREAENYIGKWLNDGKK